MATPKTPIALFIYNRPAHTRVVLEALSRCRRLDECVLKIYCDGPKRPEDAAAVSAAHEIAREWAGRLEAEVVERDSNLGLARSVVSGVSELCDTYGRVIVIEDDFSLSPAFLDYMLSALDRYADEPNVYQICGYMFPIQHAPKPDAFFLPLTTTWGWATWSRAWRVFDWQPADAEALRDPEVRRCFNLNNAYPYAEMLESKLNGDNDSWGILFWWAVFRANGLVLHPRKSLVWNGGFDASGTHGSDQAWTSQSVSAIARDEWAGKPFLFPEHVATDELAFGKVIRYLRSEQSEGNFLERLRRRILQRRGRKETERIHAN